MKDKRLTEVEVKKIMLQEIEDYINRHQIDIDNIDAEDLLDALDDFQSDIFVKYVDQDNKELMWQPYINKNGQLDIEILKM